jgi:penicillin-binding protein 2
MFLKHKLGKHLKRTINFEDVFIEHDLEEKYNTTNNNWKKTILPIERSILIIPFVVILFFFAILITRIIFLQFKGAEYYQLLAEKNRSQVDWIIPHRGVFYDRNQNQIVYNISIYNLWLNKDLYNKMQEKSEVMFIELSKLLKMTRKEIEDKIDMNKNEKRIILKENLNTEEIFNLKSQKENWPCLELESRESRDYINNKIFSHVLGYVGKITEEEFARSKGNYLKEDYIGKNGLELVYEDLLRGEIGIKSTEVSPTGIETRPLSKKEPQDGLNVLTTIDYKLQKKVYETLEETLKRQKIKTGAAIALNPQNGDVLAMVSFPSFDSNQLSQGISQKDFQKLLHAKDDPFFNRVISGTYPPGSTFKPLIALAALEENIVKPEKSFNCLGFLRIPNIYNPNISYVFRDWKAHGITNLKKAIAQSCNVYFYIIGGGYEKFKGLGIEKIKSYSKKLGLGKKTGIDLKGEAEGLIPDKAWKKRIKQEDWYIGDTYHASIGQGDISLTPLQVAQLYSFIANGETLYRPRLLLGLEEVAGSKVFNKLDPEIIPTGHFKKENIKIIREGLGEAVRTGSAQILQNLSVSSGAKTGTAQFGNESKSHAWFAAFAPYEKSEIVLVVLVEGGGGGSTTAAPVAYEILKWYFERSEKQGSDEVRFLF